MSVRVATQATDANVFHLRARAGEHEIDFIIEGDDGIVGLEVKLSATIDECDVKHLHWLKKKLGNDCINCVIVTTAYRLSELSQTINWPKFYLFGGFGSQLRPTYFLSSPYRRTDGIPVVPLALLGP